MTEIRIDKSEAHLVRHEIYASGAMQAYYVTFNFSEEWDDLTKKACFKAGENVWSFLMVEGNTVKVPWEVLTTPNVNLEIGVLGTFEDQIIFPTVWCNCGKVVLGTSDGQETKPKDPDIYEQILNIIGSVATTWRNGTGLHSVQTIDSECLASADFSVAEGQKSKAGDEIIDPTTLPIEEQISTTFGPAHAEGFATLAKPLGSHSEGYKAQALGFASHAENNSTQAKGINSHAEGVMSITLPTTGITARPTWNDAYAAHAEGHITTASGRASHTEGNNTLANNPSEHAEGQYNVSNYVDNSQYGNAGNTQHSIGIGTDNLNRKNAFEVMQNGDVYLIGVGGYDGTNISTASTVQEVISNILAMLENN